MRVVLADYFRSMKSIGPNLTKFRKAALSLLTVTVKFMSFFADLVVFSQYETQVTFALIRYKA